MNETSPVSTRGPRVACRRSKRYPARTIAHTARSQSVDALLAELDTLSPTPEVPR